jgi:hypothetical protein
MIQGMMLMNLYRFPVRRRNKSCFVNGLLLAIKYC